MTTHNLVSPGLCLAICALCDWHGRAGSDSEVEAALAGHRMANHPDVHPTDCGWTCTDPQSVSAQLLCLDDTGVNTTPVVFDLHMPTHCWVEEYIDYWPRYEGVAGYSEQAVGLDAARALWRRMAEDRLCHRALPEWDEDRSFPVAVRTGDAAAELLRAHAHVAPLSEAV